jgi:hypothetical protein
MTCGSRTFRNGHDITNPSSRKTCRWSRHPCCEFAALSLATAAIGLAAGGTGFVVAGRYGATSTQAASSMTAMKEAAKLNS